MGHAKYLGTIALALLLAGCAAAPPARSALWRCYLYQDGLIRHSVDCVCGDAHYMKCWEKE